MPAEQTGWRFRDDRGRTAVCATRPERVAAYVQAGATLWELGISPVGVFGSAHDGDRLDPGKSGRLPAGGVGYLGAVPTSTRGHSGTYAPICWSRSPTTTGTPTR